jgi:hypothetical protein
MRDAPQACSVHDLVFGGVLDVEMREVQSSDGVESALKGRVHLPAAMRRPQLGSYLPQGPEHPGPVKPLSLTVFAKVHGAPLHDERRALR